MQVLNDVSTSQALETQIDPPQFTVSVLRDAAPSCIVFGAAEVVLDYASHELELYIQGLSNK